MTKRNIVHIEIPTRDLAESGKFYQELFGWKITPMPEMDYMLWEAGEGPGGGFMMLDEKTKPSEILIHVDSDDIEADLKKATTLGAKVLVPKTEIPQIGWFAVFIDPSGNKIAIYTSMNPEFNK